MSLFLLLSHKVVPQKASGQGCGVRGGGRSFSTLYVVNIGVGQYRGGQLFLEPELKFEEKFLSLFRNKNCTTFSYNFAPFKSSILAL